MKMAPHQYPPGMAPSQQPHNPQDALYSEGMSIGLVLCQLRDMKGINLSYMRASTKSTTWWIFKNMFQRVPIWTPQMPGDRSGSLPNGS